MSKLDEHVCLFDPAIRWGGPLDDATDRDTWPIERDPKKLVLHEGKKAVVFHTAKLTFAQHAWCKEAQGETEVCGRAFRVGVRRVDKADGTPWTPIGIESKDYFAMKPDELNAFENCVIEEIGALVMQGSALPFGLRASYMVRPSSLHVWDANDRALRCAALNAERSILKQRRADPTP